MQALGGYMLMNERGNLLHAMLALGGYMLIFFVEKVAFDTDHILYDHSKGGATNGNEPAPSPIISGRGAVILLGALAVHSLPTP